MHPRTLSLSPSERAELVHIRDRSPRPYLRERAAALIKLANGQTAREVALHGLLKPRRPDTLYAWIDHFQRHRTLKTRPPCRRAFSPE